MDNNILIKNLISNTKVVYGDNLNVELVKLSISYSRIFKKIYVFGEIIGEPNDYGIEVTTTFITDDEEYVEGDESDSLYATFPGIQSFNCNLSLEDALIKCQYLKIEVERKFIYARDKYRCSGN